MQNGTSVCMPAWRWPGNGCNWVPVFCCTASRETRPQRISWRCLRGRGNPRSVAKTFENFPNPVLGLVAGSPQDYVQLDAKLLALVPEEPLGDSGFVLGAYSTEPGQNRLGFLTVFNGPLRIINDRSPE